MLINRSLAIPTIFYTICIIIFIKFFIWFPRGPTFRRRLLQDIFAMRTSYYNALQLEIVLVKFSCFQYSEIFQELYNIQDCTRSDRHCRGGGRRRSGHVVAIRCLFCSGDLGDMFMRSWTRTNLETVHLGFFLNRVYFRVSSGRHLERSAARTPGVIIRDANRSTIMLCSHCWRTSGHHYIPPYRGRIDVYLFALFICLFSEPSGPLGSEWASSNRRNRVCFHRRPNHWKYLATAPWPLQVLFYKGRMATSKHKLGMWWWWCIIVHFEYRAHVLCNRCRSCDC